MALAVPYIEPDCTFHHEGRAFTAGGAVVTPDRITAYLGKDGALTDWHGNRLGTYRLTATWRLPWNAWQSSTMSQVRAVVRIPRDMAVGLVSAALSPDTFATYTGRSLGEGMVFRGRRVASERNG
jgi:hypothetical protein